MQSTFKNKRKQLIAWLFEKSQKSYVRFFKTNKKAWNIKLTNLLNQPKETFGFQYAKFITDNGFDILKKLERHDAYHVISGYNSKVQDEIALQYLCYGNGKRSVYLFGVIILGTILLPDYLKYYIKSYHIGKNANPFYDLDYEKLLNTNLKDIQKIIFNSNYLIHNLNIKSL